MNDDHALQLLSYLREEKPVVLFLGQSFSAPGTSDQLLDQFLEHLSRPPQLRTSWSQVFSSTPILTEDYQWLAERFDRFVYMDAVSNMLDVGWSSVFTTSIDPGIVSALETRGRAPEAILARDHFPRVPRSRSRPAVHYLFGRANETEAAYRCPRSKAEVKQRISIHANQFINRIAETVTPLGLLVIDGYIPGDDWLPIDDILAPLSQETGLRILWFGLPQPPVSDFFEDMVNQGTIVFDTRTLPEVITQIQAVTAGEPLGRSTQSEAGTISLRDGAIMQVSPSLRLRVEAAATIIDDTWVSDRTPLFGTEEIEAFRRFHGDLGGARGLIEGIARGYAIKRNFEDQLKLAVDRSIKDFSGPESFVVLHGQSGVGKSVALARLAYVMRTEIKVPVLFSWDRIPTALEVDDFCAEAGKAGALGTLVLCDANQSFDRYRELSTALRSRGRRVVVVGTSYRLEERRNDRHFVEAPAEMTQLEIEALKKILIKFSGSDNEHIKAALTDKNVLALLYRYLSASRARITAGIANEARSVQQTISLRARDIPKSTNVRSLLAEKLIQAGLADGNIDLFNDDSAEGYSDIDTAGRLIDYVMVVGRLDCAVPVNLVIRALRALNNDLDIAQISYLFGELDLFRWRMADAEGNDLLIQPRLQLEAELICKRRLASIEKEIECIIQLIGAVRPAAVDRSSEVDFLLDLLPKLNREGPRSKSYESGYLQIAQALTNLRTIHQVVDSRLILQESAFRRAAIYIMDAPDANHDDRGVKDIERDEILNEAREAVEVALDAIVNKNLHASRKTHHNLLNERASIYGYLAVGLARRNASEDEIWSNYLAAKTAISNAIAVSGGYHSQDVGMWTPHDILQVPNLYLSSSKKAELRADILSIIDEVDTSLLSSISAQRFQLRRLKVGENLEDAELAEEAFSELEKHSPSVAYFIKARSMCPDVFGAGEEPFSSSIVEKAELAAAYLENRLEKIVGDSRALQLLLQLQWASFTRHRLLRSERFPIPLDRGFQEKILSTVIEMNRAAGSGARNVYRFLEATLEWVLGDTGRSRELFRNLAADTEFEDPSRVVRRLVLAAREDGQLGFKGRVERVRSDGHWTVSVLGLQRTIDLLERDFPHETLKPGRELRFNIAFNYLGPIADPTPRLGGLQ